jgi:hypothetical protein
MPLWYARVTQSIGYDITFGQSVPQHASPKPHGASERARIATCPVNVLD